jgi:hypothetical protein
MLAPAIGKYISFLVEKSYSIFNLNFTNEWEKMNKYRILKIIRITMHITSHHKKKTYQVVCLCYQLKLIITNKYG